MEGKLVTLKVDYFPEEVKKKLKVRAAKEGRTLRDLVIEILSDGVEEEE